MDILLAHMLSQARELFLLVSDNAPYNKVFDHMGTFNVWASNATLKGAIEHLRSCYEEDQSTPLSILYSTYYHPETNEKRKSPDCNKTLILSKMREIVEKPTLTKQQLMAAEMGIRKFGYPHIIRYLPVKMPSWDPVELVFALLKTYFKRNRVAKIKNGVPVGPMGSAELRQLLSRVWSFFKPEHLSNIVRHVHDLYIAQFEADTAQGQLLQLEFHQRLDELGISNILTRQTLPFKLRGAPKVPENDWRGRVRTGLTPRKDKRQAATTTPVVGPADAVRDTTEGRKLDFSVPSGPPKQSARQAKRERKIKQD